MLKKPKDHRVAALLALAGAVSPIAGWHKFYFGQPGWGCLYFTLSLITPWNPIPRVASVIEAVWYLFHTEAASGLSLPLASIPPGLNRVSGTTATSPQQVTVLGDALRELDRLRQEGLISEYEFEQKRRQLLDAK